MASSELSALIKKLKDDNPKVRAKACQQMAKLGDVEAIPELVKIYRGDPDDNTRLAAEAALRKFRAMEPQAASDEGFSPTLLKVAGGLGVLLVLLILGNVAVRLGGGTEETPEAVDTTAETREEVVANLDAGVADIEESANALKEEMGKIGNREADCGRNIPAPRSIVLTDMEQFTYPDIENFVTNIYKPQVDLFKTVYDQWKRNCRNGGFDDIQVAFTLSDNLDVVIDGLPNMRTALTRLQTNPAPTNNPDDFGKPTATPVPLPTATRTPTPLPNVDYAVHVPAMLTLVNNTLNAIATVEAGWTAANEGQSVTNCRTPELGDPYLLPEGQRGDGNLDISEQAISQALASAKESFTLFGNECAANNLRPFAEAELQRLAEARAQLEDAKLRLESIPLN